MATTPHSELTLEEEVLANTPRKPTYEEFVAAVEAWRESVRPYVPADWDPVAELIAERRAAAAIGE